MKLHNSREEVRQFIDLLKYYHDMWPMWSHRLEPLTKIMSNEIKLKWTKIEQDYFDEIKQIMDRSTLLTYLYFNETFKIRTDASDI